MPEQRKIFECNVFTPHGGGGGVKCMCQLCGSRELIAHIAPDFLLYYSVQYGK